jgi:hypothetical protein
MTNAPRHPFPTFPDPGECLEESRNGLESVGFG